METTSGAALCTCTLCLNHCDGAVEHTCEGDGPQQELKAFEC